MASTLLIIRIGGDVFCYEDVCTLMSYDVKIENEHVYISI